MLFDFKKRNLRWRRVAVYRPVRIDVDLATVDRSRSRRDFLDSCHPGMRVLLRREPTSRDRHAVALVVDGGRRIGRLPAEVAAWVAPLLDSGTAAFDAEIWSVDRGGSGPSVEHDGDRSNPRVPACRLMLTQHELAPTPRRSLAARLANTWRPFPRRTSPRSVEA